MGNDIDANDDEEDKSSKTIGWLNDLFVVESNQFMQQSTDDTSWETESKKCPVS